MGVFAEVLFFDALPACHYSRAAAELDASPHFVKVPVAYGADVFGLAGEGGELVAGPVVVVVGHGVGEAADDCSRQI